MNILLINPPGFDTVIEFPDEQGNSFLEADDYGHFPPLGLLYVATYLKNHTTGHQIHFIDSVAEKLNYEDLEKRIKEIKPDVVGITSFTIALYDIIRLSKLIRGIVSDVHICLGGHHSIAYPYEAVSRPEFDSIIVGEGEVAFTELVKALENNADITVIKGVYTFESIKRAAPPIKDKRFLNNVIVEPAYIENINDLPIPDRSFLKEIPYRSILGVSKKFTTIMSSRGCPYLCTFCNVPYKQYRQRTPENIVDEMEECIKLGYDEIHFYDDLFNITPSRVTSISEEIIKRKINVHWSFRGRVNTVTHESIKIARKAGCRMISFGVETGSDEGLKTLKKGCTIEKVDNAFKWCHQEKIITVADFMLGLPHEKSREDVLENIRYVKKLNPHYAQFNILTLYPHTEAYDQAVEKGLITAGRWHEFALEPTKDFMVDHWEEFLSLQELVKLHRYAYQTFYFNPKYIIRSLFQTKSLFEFFTKVKGAFQLIINR